MGWVAGGVLVVAVVAAAIDQSSSNGKSPSSKVGTKPSGNSPSTTDDEYERRKTPERLPQIITLFDIKRGKITDYLLKVNQILLLI